MQNYATIIGVLTMSTNGASQRMPGPLPYRVQYLPAYSSNFQIFELYVERSHKNE